MESLQYVTSSDVIPVKRKDGKEILKKISLYNDSNFILTYRFTSIRTGRRNFRRRRRWQLYFQMQGAAVLPDQRRLLWGGSTRCAPSSVHPATQDLGGTPAASLRPRKKSNRTLWVSSNNHSSFSPISSHCGWI